MKPKHTPGPWRNEGCDGFGSLQFIKIDAGEYGPTYRSVAWIQPNGGPDFDLFTAEDIANARLIAAAPELLEALKRVYVDATTFLNYGNFNEGNFTTENSSCVNGQVEWDAGYIVDAIAKATGESVESEDDFEARVNGLSRTGDE